MADNVLARLSNLISERILPGQLGIAVDSGTPLLSSGLNLDSVAVLELIMEIETEFGVQFSDSDLSVELFKTVGTLARAVEQRMNSTRG